MLPDLGSQVPISREKGGRMGRREEEGSRKRGKCGEGEKKGGRGREERKGRGRECKDKREKEKACREDGLSPEEGVRPGCGFPCGADGSGEDSTPLSQAVCPAPLRYATATPSASSSKSCEAGRSRGRYLGAWLLPGEDGGR